VILVFTLIKAVKKASSKIDEVSTQVKDIKVKLEPVIDKVQSLTENVNRVVSKVNDNIEVLSTVVDKVKYTTESIVNTIQVTTDSILAFERKVRNKIEPPVMNTANTISAVSVGIKTFFETYKKKRKNLETSYSMDVDEFIDLKESLGDVNKELEEVNDRLTDLQK
jgi:uncharacterized protein YoxC